MLRSTASCLAVLAVLAVAVSAEDAKPPERVKDWDPIVAKNPPLHRYQTFHEYVAKGPHAKVVAATCFGGKDHEYFVDAGELPDGAIVVFGNAYGPSFPEKPQALVLGSGKHQGLKPMRTAGKGEELDPADPDCAAFVVFYAPGLSAVKKAVRFDWGLANLTAARVTPDGQGLILAGRCTPAFRALGQKAAQFQVAPKTDAAPATTGGRNKPAAAPVDVYVLRLSADAEKIEWACVWEAQTAPPERLFVDKDGAIYFDAGGLRKISADGKQAKLVALTGGGGKLLCVDPQDGSAYFGGDRNTHTHKEPYRQPFLYKYDANGQKLWKLYEPIPAEMGSDWGGLEADSSVRGVTILPNGDLLINGWSDGGNTVFQRMANNWKKNCPDLGFGITPWWPTGANSYAHLVVIEPKELQTKGHMWWNGFLPDNFAPNPKHGNRTNGLSIDRLVLLSDGAAAVTGWAGTGLIQTPNAFWKDPGKGEKYGGDYVTIFNKDLSNLLFSSYVPGCNHMRLAATKKGLLVVSRCVGNDGRDPVTKSPAVSPLQDFAGATDGNVMYLELP